MIKLPALVIVVFLHLYNCLCAQESLPIPVNLLSTYKQGTRTQDGKPGDKYWQNNANYNVRVHFNPATLLVRGGERISYYNNSPDTLNNIIFKLYPNLFKKGAERAASIEPEDIGDGMVIDGVNVSNSPV